GFEPKEHLAGPQDEEVLLCACKRTGNAPFCDGAHTNLPGGSPADDPESAANRAIPLVTDKSGARALLNGACYVISPSLEPKATRGNLKYCSLVSAERGALYQNQIFLEVCGGESPVMALGDREVILFVGSGTGSVTISGRSFAIKATDGVYVRPGEA